VGTVKVSSPPPAGDAVGRGEGVALAIGAAGLPLSAQAARVRPSAAIARRWSLRTFARNIGRLRMGVS
jgi:hypothetical protein